MTTPKTPPTTIRFQPQVKEALQFISDQEGRSMANMLEWLIKQHCAREGMGWPCMAKMSEPISETNKRPRKSHPPRDAGL